MKIRLFLLWILCTLIATDLYAAEIIKISGTACENYADNQSKASIRVRVTDKASYNAVSQIPALSELKSQMLEHDFNVIVYNLVDNYVQNMSVKNTNKNDDELCVEVTGAIPSADIATVIANYSPSNPAPEYDFGKADGIEEESNTPFVEDQPTQAGIMYNGPENYDKIPAPSTAPIVYNEEKIETTSDQDELPTDITIISEEQNPEESTVEPQHTPEIEDETTQKSLVYVAPVEFMNNTHSSKPIDVIKKLFGNDDVYTVVNSATGADYIITSKVLKAKIDQINAQTRRLQMVVSAELKTEDADVSVSDYQNRFVLFGSDENEQEVAMNLLRKLLFKSGKKLFARVEQNEQKHKGRELLTPTK